MFGISELCTDIKNRLKLAKAAWEVSDKGLMDAVNIVITLVVIGVAGAIGIFIMDKVDTVTAFGTNRTGQSEARLHLMNASNNTLGTVDTGFSFVVILVIAFIGAIAIGYVWGLLPGTRK